MARLPGLSLAGILCAALLSLTGCPAETSGRGALDSPPVHSGRARGAGPTRARAAEELTARARAVTARLSDEEKCAQILMVSASSYRVRQGSTPPPGGLVFFRYSIPAGAGETAALTSALQDGALERSLPLFMAVDHEGGLVHRFRDLLTKPPAAADFGRAAGLRPERLPEIAALHENFGRQLAALGFNMNLAPMIEPRTPANAAFLASRAFAEDPELTAILAQAAAEGYRAAGVVAVGKHFPGSGDGDPHFVLPELVGSREELEAAELLPFARLLAAGVLPAVMTTHVMVPGLDPLNPATFSPAILDGLLRREWGFDGLVMTDDLRMRGVSQDFDAAAAAVKAVAGGADMIMYVAEDYPRIHAALLRALRSGEIPRSRVDEAVTRIVRVKLEYQLWSRSRPSEREARLADLGRLKSEASRRLAELGLR